MRSFKSNENIHKKEGGSYYVVSANKASSNKGTLKKRKRKASLTAIGTALANQNRMYVRRSIMYEKAAFCLPEEYSSVTRLPVPLKFDFIFSDFSKSFIHKWIKLSLYYNQSLRYLPFNKVRRGVL